jgi:hypothetical protein
MEKGSSVPCSGPVQTSFVQDSSGYKTSAYSSLGALCSLSNTFFFLNHHLKVLFIEQYLHQKDNFTSTLARSPTWDSDSVGIAIVTRPTVDALGKYNVTMSVFDYVTKTVVQAGPDTIQFTVISNSNVNTDQPTVTYFNL